MPKRFLTFLEFNHVTLNSMCPALWDHSFSFRDEECNHPLALLSSSCQSVLMLSIILQTSRDHRTISRAEVSEPRVITSSRDHPGWSFSKITSLVFQTIVFCCCWTQQLDPHSRCLKWKWTKKRFIFHLESYVLFSSASWCNSLD